MFEVSDGTECNVNVTEARGGLAIHFDMKTKNSRRQRPDGLGQVVGSIKLNHDTTYPEKLMRLLYQQTETGDFCDVVMKASGQEFWAHGFVLRFHGSFFEQRLTEFGSTRSVIDVDNEFAMQIDPKILGQIVKFIYMGEAGEISDCEKFNDAARIFGVRWPMNSSQCRGNQLAYPFIINLREEMKSKTTCDIVLLVDGKRFYAHRSILAASGHYFAAMFGHGMAETYMKEIELPFLTEDLAIIVLTYIYNGVIFLDDVMARDINTVAEYLGMPHLKSMCRKFTKM